MPVKGLLKLSFLAVLAMAGTASVAQTPPRSMLGEVDLKSTILSPEPLGPPSQFVPPAATAASPPAAPPVAAKPTTPPPVAEKATPKTTVGKARAASPPRLANTRPRQKSAVAARKPRASPLNSYATDTRRQTWPCTGGGICAWTQPR